MRVNTICCVEYNIFRLLPVILYTGTGTGLQIRTDAMVPYHARPRIEGVVEAETYTVSNFL